MRLKGFVAALLLLLLGEFAFSQRMSHEVLVPAANIVTKSNYVYQQTIGEPVALAEVLLGHDGFFRATLVDCVTLWLTNMLLATEDREGVLAEVRRTAGLFAGLQTPLYLVSNEVGMGIVPDTPLGRTFRDLAGEANEILAQAADEAYVVFSGLPLKLK